VKEEVKWNYFPFALSGTRSSSRFAVISYCYHRGFEEHFAKRESIHQALDEGLPARHALDVVGGEK
jgi:hypothetical protein